MSGVARMSLVMGAMTATTAGSAQMRAEISLNCANPSHVYLPGEAIVATFRASGERPADAPLTLSWRVSDFQEREVLAGAKQVPPGGRAEAVETVRLAGYGVFHVCLTVKAGQEQPMEARTNFAVFPPTRERHQDPDSMFGLCFTNLDLAEWTGVRWERRDILWAALEPQKGRFNWGVWDPLVEAYASAGIELMPIIDYCAPWASTLPEGAPGSREYSCPRLEDWRDYVTAVVSRYRGRIRAWEIWNEPGPGFGCGSPAEYFGVLRTAYEAAKQADPDCTIVGLGGGPLPLLEEILELGAWQYMDAVSIHPYAWHESPEGAQYLRAIEATDELMVRHGGRKPIWLTEFGWSASDLEPEFAARGDVLTERIQAAYVVRSYVLAASHPAVEKVFWFLHRHPSRSLKESLDSGEGLFNPDGTVKPAALAYRTLVDTLDGAEFVEGAEHEGAWVRTFRRAEDGKERLISVAWNADGEGLFACRSLARNVQARDLMGNPCEPALSPDRKLILLDEAPIYLEGPPPVVGESLFSVADDDVFLGAGHTGRATVTVRAPRGRSLQGHLAVEAPPGLVADPSDTTIILRPGQSQEVALNIVASAEAPLGWTGVRVRFQPEGMTGGTGQQARVAVLAPQEIVLDDFEAVPAGWRDNAGETHVRASRFEAGDLATSGRRSLRWRCASALWCNLTKDFSGVDFSGARQIEFQWYLPQRQLGSFGLELRTADGYLYGIYPRHLLGETKPGEWRRVVLDLADAQPHVSNPDQTRQLDPAQLRSLTFNLTAGDFDVYIDNLMLRK